MKKSITALLYLILCNCNKSFKINEYINKGSGSQKKENENNKIKKGKDYDLITLLLEASKKGNIKDVRELLNKGANPNILNANGESPLMLAMSTINKKIIKLLLEKGAKTDIVDISGNSALMQLCKDREIYVYYYMYKLRYKIAKILIKAGANVNIKNNYGNTALIYLCSSPPIVSSNDYRYELVEMFIEAGADINAKNIYGETALMFASSKGHEKVVKLLLDNSSIENIDTESKNGYTALLHAIHNNHKDTVKELLNRGANPGILDAQEDTILARIVKIKYKNIIYMKDINLVNIKFFAQEFKNKNTLEAVIKIMVDNENPIQLLFYKDKYFDLERAFLFLKEASNFNEKLKNKVIEKLDIIKFFSYDNFLFKNKSLLMESLLYIVKQYKLEKIYEVKDIKEKIIASLLDYYKEKLGFIEGYDVRFLEKLSIIKDKINIFVAYLHRNIKYILKNDKVLFNNLSKGGKIN